VTPPEDIHPYVRLESTERFWFLRQRAFIFLFFLLCFLFKNFFFLLARLHSAGSEALSTLSEFLRYTLSRHPTKLVLVEVKVPWDDAHSVQAHCGGATWLETPAGGAGARAGRLAAACVRASGASAAQVAVISFDATALAAAQAEFQQEGYPCVLLALQTSEAGALAVVEVAARRGLDGVDLRADLSCVTARVVAASAAAGLAAGVWVWVDRALGPECDGAGAWAEFQQRGVALFTSDLPTPAGDRWLETFLFTREVL
jgi:hypothetical protein